jgi:hypothetical protein
VDEQYPFIDSLPVENCDFQQLLYVKIPECHWVFSQEPTAAQKPMIATEKLVEL